MSGLGWYRLRRHPLTVEAHFVRSLVLTYAFEAADLARMLPPGLAVDRYGQWGFVAIALVETEALRPTILPRGFGQAFFLAGYRIFTTFKPAGGGTLRGLYILRSDTNRRLMARAGNLLTHYRYRVSQVMTAATTERFSCGIVTRDGAADLRVTANLAATRNLPPTTPFARAQDARRFAGPLPYTFDHERETHSIIVIKGVRKNWNPRLVDVRVDAVNFLERGAFAGLPARLASAFYVADIDYRWERGIRHRLARTESERDDENGHEMLSAASGPQSKNLHGVMKGGKEREETCVISNRACASGGNFVHRLRRFSQIFAGIRRFPLRGKSC